MSKIRDDREFETQRAIMHGTWDYWSDRGKRQQVKILVREAHKVRRDWDNIIYLMDE